MCTVRAAHTCRSLMLKRSSTTYAPRGASDSLQPGFPASEANLASFLPRMGCDVLALGGVQQWLRTELAPLCARRLCGLPV